MAEFLSAAWLAHLDELARAREDLVDDAAEPLVIELQILRSDGSTLVYHFVIGPAPARVLPGPAEDADLTLVVTEHAAQGIHDGTTNAQTCLADGTLRLRGNPDVLNRGAALMDRVGDLFADARR